MLCQENDESKITVYCVDHNIYLCDECYITSHSNHNVKILESDCAIMLSDYQKLLYNLKAMSASFTKHLQEKDELLCSITSKVNKEYDNLIEAINHHRKDTIANIMQNKRITAYQQQCADLKDNKFASLNLLEAEIKKGIDFIKSCVSNQKYIDVLKNKQNEQLSQIKLTLSQIQLNKASTSLSQEIKDFKFYIKLNYDALHKYITHTFTGSSIYSYFYDTESYKLIITAPQLTTICSKNKIHVPYHAVSCILTDSIFFCGGDDDGYKVTAYKFDINSAMTLQLHSMLKQRSCHSLVTDRVYKIYCIGGFNTTEGPLKSAEVYDIISDKWSEYPQLNTPRQYSSSILINDTIYVVSGSHTNSIEYIKVTENKKWEFLKVQNTLLTNLAYSGIAAPNPENIYIFGGYGKDAAEHSYILNATTLQIVRIDGIKEETCFGVNECMFVDDSIYATCNDSRTFIYSIGKKAWRYIQYKLN